MGTLDEKHAASVVRQGACESDASRDTASSSHPTVTRRCTQRCDVVSMETRQAHRSYRLIARVTVQRCQRYVTPPPTYVTPPPDARDPQRRTCTPQCGVKSTCPRKVVMSRSFLRMVLEVRTPPPTHRGDRGFLPPNPPTHSVVS